MLSSLSEKENPDCQLGLHTIGDFQMRIRVHSTDEKNCRSVIERAKWRRHVFVEAGQCWVNIGAGIGAFTLELASRGCRVHAFEPDPANHALLMENLNLNAGKFNREMVTVYKAAVTAHIEPEMTLFRAVTRDKLSSTLYRKQRSFEGRVTVTNVHLRNLMNQIRPAHLKIDAEGSEYEILANIDDRQYGRIKQICYEWHPYIVGDRDWTKRDYVLDRLRDGFANVTYKRYSHGQPSVMSARKNRG